MIITFLKTNVIYNLKIPITATLNETLVILIANYPDQLGPSHRFVNKSTKLTYLGTTGYRIKYTTALVVVILIKFRYSVSHEDGLFQPKHVVTIL